MRDFADCLITLDTADTYTFRDRKRGRESRLYRDGSAVVVQLHRPAWPDEASFRIEYANFRAGVLAALRRYQALLDRRLPEHPETEAFRRKLSDVEAQDTTNERSPFSDPA